MSDKTVSINGFC